MFSPGAWAQTTEAESDLNLYPTYKQQLTGTALMTPMGSHWVLVTHQAYGPQLDSTWSMTCLTDKERGVLGAVQSPQELVFLDLETCGFAGTPLFLVGLMTLSENTATVIQLLARNYEEEAAVIHSARLWLRSAVGYVSFNGRSYDLPFLRDRAQRHRLGQIPDRPHFDLLHAARRRWKHNLPNCRLKTLEQTLLDRYRLGDVPGRDVPDLYHQYVKTGDPSLIAGVLDHNLLDLVSLAGLLGCILQTRVDRV